VLLLRQELVECVHGSLYLGSEGGRGRRAYGWHTEKTELADIGASEKAARKRDVQRKIAVVLLFLKRVSRKACFSASIVRSLL